MPKKERIFTASARRIMLVLGSLNSVYEYMYCSMLASAMGLLPVYGGAMSMSAQVALTFTHYVLGDGRKYLSRRKVWLCAVLLALMLICSILLLSVYPVLIGDAAVWIVIMVVLSLSLGSRLARRLVGRKMRRTVGNQAFYGLMALLVAVPLGVVCLLMLNNMPISSALQMLTGYIMGLLMEGYTLWRERDLIAVEGAPDDIDAAAVERIEGELRQVNAYGAFQRMHTLVMLALQLSLVLVYTFIGFSTEELLNCMILTAACALVMLEATSFCLRRMKKSFATQMLLVGIFLWMYGLMLFYRQLGAQSSSLWAYLSLSLSVSGLSISVTSLADLERRMTDVAVFQLKDHMRGYSQLRAASTEIAILVGQMLALICLELLCLPAGVKDTHDLSPIVAAFRPILIVPPMVLVVAAFVSVLHFPMNNRHFQKLAKWLTLSEGEDNPALKKQLESVVVKRHKNRFGVKIIIALLRPIMYHKVVGRENVAPYEDGQMILVCNHGELYGPVVANLYIPVSFRPWVISNMMDKEAIIEHVYQGTMVRQKWLPERWKRPLLRRVAPLVMWIFGSLEAIPVYRGKPRELMQTFRQTIEAMQAGDNILLFPENGEEQDDTGKGYASEGVGQLYTGFAMIARMYWTKTRKRAAFIPVYASRRTRTLTIGKGILYDPDAPANDEKLRIVRELTDSMTELYKKELATQQDKEE